MKTQTPTLVLALTLLLTSAAVEAQETPPSRLHRVLQVASIAAPTLDSWATLRNRPYGNITESNLLLRGRDGAAVPWRVVTVKSAQSIGSLYALSLARHRGPKTKTAIYVLVAAVSGVDVYAAIHNARLEGTYYRYRYHY